MAHKQTLIMFCPLLWMTMYFEWPTLFNITAELKSRFIKIAATKENDNGTDHFFQRLQTFFPLFHDAEISGRRTKDTGPTNAIIFSVQLIELAFQILHFRIRMPKLRCQIEMNEN